MCAGNNSNREQLEARDKCPTREDGAAAAGDETTGKGGGGGSDVSPAMWAPTDDVRLQEQLCRGMLVLKRG